VQELTAAYDRAHSLIMSRGAALLSSWDCDEVAHHRVDADAAVGPPSQAREFGDRVVEDPAGHAGGPPMMIG
jgi:hypothetical protein